MAEGVGTSIANLIDKIRLYVSPRTSSKWELIHNPLGSILYLCAVLYVTITYTALVLNSEKQSIVESTLIGVVICAILFTFVTKSNFFFNSRRYTIRFVEIMTSILSYIAGICFALFVFDLSEGMLDLAFVFGLFSAFPLLYLLMRDGVVPRATYTALRQLLIFCLRTENKVVRVLRPYLDENGHIDFIFSSDEIKSRTYEIADPTGDGALALHDAAYLIRSNTLSSDSSASEFIPATSSAIQHLSHQIRNRIRESNHTQDVEKHTLAQLLFMHIFRNPRDYTSRWTNNSAISLAAKNKPSTLLIGPSNSKNPDLIVHYWDFEQLASAASILYLNLPWGSKPSSQNQMKNLNSWLKKSLEVIENDKNTERNGKLERNKIYHYLAMLSKSGLLGPQQNEERWKGMIEGYCAGCEFSIGQITTDKQILNPDPKIPTHNTLTSRIDQGDRLFYV